MQTTQLLLTGTIVLASFAGGLVSVLIGQFLSYYRNQRQEIEELYYLIQAVDDLETDYTPYSIDNISELTEDLSEQYLRNRWWMNESLERTTGQLIQALNTIEVVKRDLEENDGTQENGLPSYKKIKDEREYELAIEYSEKAVRQIDENFQRIPLRRFMPRYWGNISQSNSD